MKPKSLIRLALTLLAVAAGSSAAPAQDAVQVPNFWDPRAHLERPASESIGPIRFLVTDDFPPFSFRDRRGALIGFDIELADQVCAVLKVECAVQVRPFDTLREGLKDGTGDAILAGFDPEKANDEGLIATQAYLKIPGRFVARRDGGFDPTGSAPRGFVGVACDSAHHAFLTRFFPNFRTACYTSTSTALGELKAGRLTAVFGDAVGLAFWLHGTESADCCAFAGGPYLDDRYFGGGLAIVMQQEDRALKLALDYALREVHRSGMYEELYLRYFPISLF